MDLTARVSALEEENSLLKGEIKTILQELRTAVLSRENPFTSGGLEPPTAISARTESPAMHTEQHTQDAAAAQSANIVRMFESAAFQDNANFQAGRAHAQAWPPAQEPAPAAIEETASRWSVHSLAALMAWTKEAAARFNPNDLSLILQLARYGRLIDDDLENTLAALAETFAPADVPPAAGSNDYLLALRQLDALLDEANNQAGKPAARRIG